MNNQLKISTKSPAQAERELDKTCRVKYILYEETVMYKGYDISKFGGKPIVEVVHVNKIPVQVRFLNTIPFIKRDRGLIFDSEASDIQFGGF